MPTLQTSLMSVSIQNKFEGVKLFRLFRRFVLTIQMRAEADQNGDSLLFPVYFIFL